MLTESFSCLISDEGLKNVSESFKKLRGLETVFLNLER